MRWTIVLMLLLSTGLGLHFGRPSIVPDYKFPALQVDGWQATDEPIDPDTRAILGNGDFLVRTYTPENQPDRWVNLYVAFFPSQATGDTIHSPEHCLPGAGWIPESHDIMTIILADGSSFMANRYVMSKGDQRILVIYWFDSRGKKFASEYAAKCYLVRDAITLNRTDGGMVRLMSPIPPGETPQQTQDWMMKLGNRVVPALDFPH